MANFDINQQVRPRPAAGRDINQRETTRPGPASEPSRNPPAGTVPTATPGLKTVRRTRGCGDSP
jgi:hypothetical protein